MSCWIAKLGILHNAGIVFCGQYVQCTLSITKSGVISTFDAIPRQGIFFLAFAPLCRIDRRWERNIGHHTFVLRAAAVNAVELSDGVLHAAQWVFVEVVDTP